jgi:glycosyltransferase involved in cell wall biosynthesis
VKSEDPQALADTLRKYFFETDKQKAMRSNARQHFMETFEMDQGIRREADWFERIVSSDPSTFG